MKSLFYGARGTLSFVLYFINTIFWFIPIMVFSLLKLAPLKVWQKWMSIIVDNCATCWISVNSFNQRIFSRTQFIVQQSSDFTLNAWYLVIANHQSWVDILVLQRVFNRRIPFLKFFLKKNLLYVPILGLAWWGLDFPFMQRYSKAQLEKNPELKGKDLETTKKACEKYEHKPVSIMNFVEGTRFSEQKLNNKVAQSLQLTHTLAPKTGGIAFVLSAMGNQLTQLIDVTIYYPKGIPTYWDFISGRVKKVVIDIEAIDVKTLLSGDIYSNEYFNDASEKAKFQDYMNHLWQQKNQKLIRLEQEHK
jgi:1-acyl-sn-glycerol-3-phosphate acyltransferase